QGLRGPGGHPRGHRHEGRRSLHEVVFTESQQGPFARGALFLFPERKLGMRNALALLVLALLGLAPQQTPTYPPPAQVREAFLKQLDRKKIPLQGQGIPTRTEGGLTEEEIVF